MCLIIPNTGFTIFYAIHIAHDLFSSSVGGPFVPPDRRRHAWRKAFEHWPVMRFSFKGNPTFSALLEVRVHVSSTELPRAR